MSCYFVWKTHPPIVGLEELLGAPPCVDHASSGFLPVQIVADVSLPQVTVVDQTLRLGARSEDGKLGVEIFLSQCLLQK